MAQQSKSIPLSVLELSIVPQGGDARTAMERSVQLAQHLEGEGYRRIWFAEHHNMPHNAGSATSLIIGHVAGHTSSIRVGAGGIMLPNHSPLAIAEQFGTLDTIYPGRIDLGLGRAPGTDGATAMALRGTHLGAPYDFGSNIAALQRYFSKDNAGAAVRAFPGEGRDIPIWVLGSSMDSAYLAAEMGLPYAFASHFAPAQFLSAIEAYRRHFKPSSYLEQPYVMAAVNVVGADTDEEAAYLTTSLYQLFLGLFTGDRKPLQPPVASMEGLWNEQARAGVASMASVTFVGSEASLRQQLRHFIAATGVDEIMAVSHIYDMGAKLASFSILKRAMAED